MGTCEPSTITVASDYPECEQDANWNGDGYCDALNNKAECLFDKGDCCIQSEASLGYCDPADKPECACKHVGKFIFHFLLDLTFLV